MRKKQSINPKKQERTEWEDKFLEKIKCVHKRNLSTVVKKILKRVDTVKYGLLSRSRKYGVACEVTTEELRRLIYDNYGTPCKYCGKILKLDNMVVDHIIPISRQGSSNIDNLQVICKTSNGVKGSLSEDNLQLLLEWLDSVPEDLKKDILTRLARGVV